MTDWKLWDRATEWVSDHPTRFFLYCCLFLFFVSALGF